jgi:hypothetical protein
MSSARWIWTSLREYVNQHLYLRKRFELPASATKAIVQVTADTRYQLFVNGVLVGRGPARGFPQSLPLDELDITPYLRKGPNVLAAHVLSFGISTAQNVFRDRAGFFLEGKAVCENGAAIELDSNHTWRLKDAKGYRRYVSRSGSQMGFQEHYDAARDAFDPDGINWMQPGFDDADWQRPHVLGTAGALPWRSLQPREVPLLQTSVRAPQRCVGQWEGVDLLARAGHDESSDVMATVRAEQRVLAAQPWFESPEALLSGSGGGKTTVKPPPQGRFAACVLDFGETHFGYTLLKISGALGGEVFDLVYGELSSDSGVDVSLGSSNPSEAYDTSIGDRLICRAGSNRFESFQARGFRHLMLIARNLRQPIMVEQVAISEIAYPAPVRGSFSCSDPLLTSIWETGVRTLRHCMADTFIDCPTRSQEQGWGSVRIAGTVAAYTLGDLALYRRGLKLMAQSLLPDGLLLGVVPSERPDCVIPDYCLHWIASLHEYYQFTADLKTLKEHRDTLEKVLSFFAVHAGERGLLGAAPNYTLFLDWAPGLDRGNLSATYNLLYLHALRHAIQIGNILGFTGFANHCARQAESLAERIVTAFSTSHRSLLVESVDMRTGEPSDLVSQHATALAVLENVLGRRPILPGAPSTRGAAAAAGPVGEVLSNFLAPPGADAVPGPVRANLFFRYFVHRALVSLGLGQVALEDIRRTWGHMLDAGATTWWERMPLKQGASRCHVWSAHPTAFLSQHVLGVFPMEAGWRRFGLDPQRFNLEHASGKVPTPHGDIEIKWVQNAQKLLEIDLKVPPNTEAYVTLSKSELPRVLKAGSHQFIEGD